MIERIRVLHVDASAADRSRVRSVLAEEPERFDLREAGTRPDWEARLAEADFDVVLCDLEPFGLSTAHILTAVRETQPRLPVILLAAGGTVPEVAEAMKRGASDFLLKEPAQFQRLPAIIQVALARSRLTDRESLPAPARPVAEDRYRQIVELSPNGIFIECDGCFRLVNGTLVQLLGARNADELLGRPVLEYVHPDFRDVVRERMRRLRGAVLPLPLIEEKFLRRDGSAVDVEVAASPFVLAGRPAAQVVVRDISERLRAEAALRESQARLAGVLDSAMDAIVVMGEDQRIVLFNAAAVQMFRCAAVDALGRPIDQFMPERFRRDHAEHVYAFGRSAVATRAMIARGPIWGRRTDGEEFPMEASISQIRVADKKVFTAILRDITQRLQAETALQENAARLEALSHRLVKVQETERRHVARELHDEVGQVLTGLKLLLDMSAALPLAQVQANLTEARGLVDEILRQVRELSLQLRPQLLDDLGLLPALEAHLRRYTAQTGIRVDFQSALTPPRLPPDVETALFRLAQEALTNVARHAQVADVTVQLSFADGRVTLRVEEEGVGFDVARALAAGASSGLTGMRERAVLLGGTFSLTSSTGGRGTRLTVEIPIPERGDKS